MFRFYARMNERLYTTGFGETLSQFPLRHIQERALDSLGKVHTIRYNAWVVAGCKHPLIEKFREVKYTCGHTFPVLFEKQTLNVLA